MTAAANDRSGIYLGWIRHRRTRPVPHGFTYPLFMVMLDIDRISDLMRVSWLTGHNRAAVASFDDDDHLPGTTGSLRERLQRDAALQGLRLGPGPVYLLTQLRCWGYVFNPVSFYYCFDEGGALQHVMAEVNNTYGGSTNYWLTPDAAGTDDDRTPVRRFCATAKKTLYVSPFMPDAVQYRFWLAPPSRQLVVHITASDASQTPLFDATLSMRRRPWTAASFRAASWQYPLMTMRVTAAIHWEALKLWLKGVPVVPRTAAGS